VDRDAVVSPGGRFDREVVVRLVVIALASRLLVLGVAAVAERSGAPSVTDARSASGTQLRLTDTPLLASLTAWDGFYYVDIARHGYSAGPVNGPYPNSVFFPLYPALLRVVHDLTGIDWLVVAILLSNAAFVAAIALFGVLSMRAVPGRWLTAVTFLSFAPGGTAFGMAYADSLFLLLVAAAFVAAERGASRASGVLYLLATLTRPLGIILGLPLALLLWQQRGGHPQRSRMWAIATLVLGPLGLLGFMAYQGIAVGDPLAFVHGQAVWSQGVEAAASIGAGGGAPDDLAAVAAITGLTVLAVAVAYTVAALVFVIRRRDAYGVYAVVGAGAPYVIARLASLDRYLAPVLPVYWLVTRARLPVRLLWGIGSAVILVVLSYLTFRLRLPP
jgi:hypothetical protein